MTRYKVTISYDGTRYHGWQTQQKGNSISEAVEQVLETIQQKKVMIHASGRTDARVHAIGQVFHFDSSLHMDAKAYVNALNGLLPKDIRVINVEEVDATFHARFDTVNKRYDYYLSRDMNNPFLHNYTGRESMILDIEAMRKAASLFLGTHDFTSFTSSRIDPRKSRIKTISRITIEEEGSTTHFIFEGDGFLRYMIRMITQTLIEVGKNKITVADVQQMIACKDKHVCKYKAQPQGLYLVRVDY